MTLGYYFFRIHILHSLNAIKVSRLETINPLPSISLADSANPPPPNSRRMQSLVMFLLSCSNELNPNFQNVHSLFQAVVPKICKPQLVPEAVFLSAKQGKPYL